MILYDMIWYDAIRYDMVWYDLNECINMTILSLPNLMQL